MKSFSLLLFCLIVTCITQAQETDDLYAKPGDKPAKSKSKSKTPEETVTNSCRFKTNTYNEFSKERVIELQGGALAKTGSILLSGEAMSINGVISFALYVSDYYDSHCMSPDKSEVIFKFANDSILRLPFENDESCGEVVQAYYTVTDSLATLFLNNDVIKIRVVFVTEFIDFEIPIVYNPGNKYSRESNGQKFIGTSIRCLTEEFKNPISPTAPF